MKWMTVITIALLDKRRREKRRIYFVQDAQYALATDLLPVLARRGEYAGNCRRLSGHGDRACVGSRESTATPAPTIHEHADARGHSNAATKWDKHAYFTRSHCGSR